MLGSARSVTVLTGAGASAESGIPTFRGPGGLWKQFRPEELATPGAFARDPKFVWEWYDYRRNLIAQALPNPGHRALARLEERCPRFTLITQNVDDLHERAGSKNVLHVHGSIWTVRCLACNRETNDPRPSIPTLPPLCLDCGGVLRPGVVWFGERLPEHTWSAAVEAAASCEILLIVGTSLAVYPAAGLMDIARSAGAAVLEINPDTETGLRGLAGQILPELIP